MATRKPLHRHCHHTNLNFKIYNENYRIWGWASCTWRSTWRRWAWSWRKMDSKVQRMQPATSRAGRVEALLQGHSPGSKRYFLAPGKLVLEVASPEMKKRAWITFNVRFISYRGDYSEYQVQEIKFSSKNVYIISSSTLFYTQASI